MFEKAIHTSELITRHLENSLTPEEEAQLQAWLEESGRNQTLFAELTSENAIANELKSFQRFHYEEGRKRMDTLRKKRSIVRRMQSRRWWAAASVAVLLGIGSYFIFFNKPDKSAELAAEKPLDIPAPTTIRATVTLDNGRTIYLDAAANGTLATQAGTSLVKTADGQIAYEGPATQAGVVYNTLSNPRGSRVIAITLSDGTRVWLNAGSAIRYPVAFAGTERKVSMTGEAYFEVAHNAAMPFKVSKGAIEVSVLGTRFNVNAYDNEPVVKITLLEGSVKVSAGPAGNLLKPGQQAQVTRHIKVVSNADVDEVMAWKNGEFQFGDKADIGTIMRQISRWYDIEVEYKGTIGGHIGGSISRDASISQVLEMLEKTGGVSFSIQKNKVTVMP